MADWFNKYMKINVTAKLTMIASVAMSWRCAEWFMNLEDPTTQQSAFVSVIMGVMTGVYGIYLGREAKGKQMKYIRTHLIKQLVQSEGLRLEVYQDTLGIDTIGVGRNLEDRGITQEELDTMDIPNIETVYEYGITEVDAAFLLENDVQIVEEELVRAHPCVDSLDSVRQLVLVDMAFNMGVPRLCKFKKMWNAVHEEDFPTAAKEMLDSRWANQVKGRATKLANAMHNGEF